MILDKAPFMTYGLACRSLILPERSRKMESLCCLNIANSARQFSGENVLRGCQKPEIMADHLCLARPTTADRIFALTTGSRHPVAVAALEAATGGSTASDFSLRGRGFDRDIFWKIDVNYARPDA